MEDSKVVPFQSNCARAGFALLSSYVVSAAVIPLTNCYALDVDNELYDLVSFSSFLEGTTCVRQSYANLIDSLRIKGEFRKVELTFVGRKS